MVNLPESKNNLIGFTKFGKGDFSNQHFHCTPIGVYWNTKEQVVEWMLDIQLGRRNLSPIQRIAVAEKYRPIYEKMAKENKVLGGGDKKSDEYKKTVTVNLPQPIRNPTTDKKLADIAGVSEKTYRMGAKVLNSDNEDVKNRVLSGETSISAGYKEHSP